MTENTRRWRGYHLLETITAHIRGEIPWEPMHPTQGVPRGMYDPTHGWYDQTAGPRDIIPGPKLAIVTIRELPAINYPGEEITITPTWIRFRIHDLHRASLFLPVREYARGDATYTLANYWPSRKQVAWSNAAPKPIRDAALTLSDAVALNPRTRGLDTPHHPKTARNLVTA